jgi:hypothetical protein
VRIRGHDSSLLSCHITSSMEQGPSPDGNQCSSSKKMAAFYGNWKFITATTRTRQFSSHKHNLSKCLRVQNVNLASTLDTKIGIEIHVMLYLWLIQHDTVKVCRRMEVSIHAFVIEVLFGSEWLTSRAGPLQSWEKRRRNGLNKRVHRPQRGFECFGEKRAFFSLREIAANFSVCPA